MRGCTLRRLEVPAVAEVVVKYTQPKFSVNVGGPEYAEGWDRIFGPKPEVRPIGERLQEAVDRLATSEWWKSVRIPTSDIRDQVEEFHHVMGLPVGDKPEVPSTNRLRLRLNLIAEEFCELLEAVGVYGTDIADVKNEVSYALGRVNEASVNMVEVADALGDLDYVIEGMRLELGINGKPIADEIHRSNLSKVGPNGVVERREDGKVIKGPNFSPPDIHGELVKQGWEP